MANAQRGNGVLFVKDAFERKGRLYVPITLPAGITQETAGVACSGLMDTAAEEAGVDRIGRLYFFRTAARLSESPLALEAYLLPARQYIMYEDIYRTIAVSGRAYIAALIGALNRRENWTVGLPDLAGDIPTVTVTMTARVVTQCNH
jgi:hypothetical protein